MCKFDYGLGRISLIPSIHVGHVSSLPGPVLDILPARPQRKPLAAENMDPRASGKGASQARCLGLFGKGFPRHFIFQIIPLFLIFRKSRCEHEAKVAHHVTRCPRLRGGPREPSGLGPLQKSTFNLFPMNRKPVFNIPISHHFRIDREWKPGSLGYL